MSLHDTAAELMTVLMRCTNAEYGAGILAQFKDAVLADALRESEVADLTVYRAGFAGHDIPLGTYRTREAARAHCEAFARREEPYAQQLAWYPETGDEDSAEGLFVVVAGAESDSGYLVTPVTVASMYDEEAEEW